MKFCQRALLLFLLILPAAIQASTTAPMFAGSPGTTLAIHGETYTWTGPGTEEGTWHYDTYANTTSQTVTVTGMIGFPDLATVIGSSSTGTVDGHLSAGVYGDSQTNFTDDGSWQIDGVTYTHRNSQENFTVTLAYGQLIYSGFDDYTGPNGNLHRWWGDGESHLVFSGGTTYICGQPSFTIFGTTYTFTDASRSEDNYSDANLAGWTDKYSSLNGGTLRVIAATNYSVTSYYLQIWDPDLGTVTANTISTVPNSTLAGITWPARADPTFARPQLWLDGKLLNWQSGTITTSGLLTDTYTGAGITLTVSALAHDYFAGGTNAAVTITSTGGGTGTLGHDGAFTLSGHVLQNASPNHSAPLFASSKTVLRVAGTNYAFTGGFQDSLGNRIDIYANPSYGMIVMKGSISDPNHASVIVSKFGTTRSGTYSNGAFSVSGFNVVIPSQPSIYGPPAFWVRGEFYLRNADTLFSYASAADHSLFLTGGSTWTLSGTDAIGTFSGECSKDPVGVFLVQDAQGVLTVPVIPANADGSLHLSWTPPPSGMPPAVIQNTRILVFLGTTLDDTNPAATAAYYGGGVASDQSSWLLKLRTDGNSTTPYTATYTDYSTASSTASSTTGSYSAQTHLFQTSAIGSGFPVPVYGVEPNANFSLWGLSQPDSATGLPATFLVQGNVWRYTGTNNGHPTYQGYYTNQQMTLTALDEPDGGWVVQVTNPQHGDGAPTQGTLNDVRGSVRLRDGTEVYSGNFDGQLVDPTLNPNKLHTIAADLDITGNLITFGSLTGNAAAAGVTLQFQDVAGGNPASLYSILARPQAQWLWERAAINSVQPPLPVMKLGATHKLTLYDSPAVNQSQNAGVVLDPQADGVSTIRGVLRIRPGGDIDMGDFVGGGKP